MNYILNDCTDACRNMALDEYMLESVSLEGPVFCLWRNAPSVIIGLNQNAYSEVNLPYLKEKGIALARRVTGGGAVYHDLQNLNYSIAARACELQDDRPVVIVEALRDLGLDAQLSGRNDILVDGRKCSGYAKRVWKDRMLIHGTLLWDVDFDVMNEALRVPGGKLDAAGVQSVRSRVVNIREFLPSFDSVLELRDALHSRLAGDGHEIVLDVTQRAQVERMAEEKFRSWDWIYGRSRGASFKASRKFSCGTIEADWELEGGRVARISFGGDFLGRLPASSIEQVLTGVRFDRASILAALSASNPAVSDCFDSLSAEELAGLLMQE